MVKCSFSLKSKYKVFTEMQLHNTISHNINLGKFSDTITVSYSKGQHKPWLAVWLSGNALASINVVALRQTRLVPGWVTVCGRVNHLSM